MEKNATNLNRSNSLRGSLDSNRRQSKRKSGLVILRSNSLDPRELQGCKSSVNAKRHLNEVFSSTNLTYLRNAYDNHEIRKIQDPLSRPKLQKMDSSDSTQLPIFKIGDSFTDLKTFRKSSSRTYERRISDDDSAPPSVLFPSVR